MPDCRLNAVIPSVTEDLVKMTEPDSSITNNNETINYYINGISHVEDTPERRSKGGSKEMEEVRDKVARNAEDGIKKTKIQKFYEGKHIFITGATGFLGKTLMEKLLRSCPDLDTLYVLVRHKKGKDAHSRMDDIFDDPVFSVLKREFPKFRYKVYPILGECSAPQLGLSNADRQLLIEKVEIIFHAAATVKFDEQLRTALAVNVSAPLQLLSIAKEMKHLQVLMHVSTAYSNCHLNRVEERLYASHPPPTLRTVSHMISTLNDAQIDSILPTILGPWPNTYTFTKAMAEQEIRNNCGKLPITIFRPAIVTSSFKEPIQAWIDNMYGPTGAVAGGATGMLRSMHCDAAVTAEIVPVDFVVNCLIVAAAHTATVKRSADEEPKVYNYVSSVENRITWGDFMHLICQHGFQYPLISAIWYRSLTLNKSARMNAVYQFFLHILPAFCIDGLALCFGKTPKLMKVYRKIHKFSAVIAHFTTHEISFTNDNVRRLWSLSSPEDKKIYPFSMSELDWAEYFTVYLRGIRTFIFKESDDSLKSARIKWNRLYYLHQTVKVLFFACVIYVLWTIVDGTSKYIAKY